ncbi:substrate-binding domain-containing protein [Amorphoplanes digitatis]|uniref:DNA-binding LacI/PurR family transcriptional regulator n=1 Tax=Actinoplanes digitatis TaxID=1868 RepID=A0A7W7I198_9ACTN|nr:substrate-binding domain-containing protein [Actinoplanes digitatis]MBB4764535.1 DNA-binding LacI/PurR family transcriptional regulator [Actinoplanes digitatis]GID91513.1 LacI family transcriptional regulator [Actinoplanes digitatis]
MQRRERLMIELRQHGAVRVVELAELLQVSQITVRRDIAALAQARLLTKVHGGAVLPTELAPAPRRARKPATRFTLGMVVPTLDFFWPPVIAGARTASAVLGVDIRLRGSSYDVGEDRRQITRLLDSEQISGLLLAPDLDSEHGEEMLAWIAGLPVPCVMMERQTPSARLDSVKEAERTPPAKRSSASPLEWVRSDHDAGVETALRHLVRQGNRRIGLVLTPISPNADHIAQGFARACSRLNLAGDLVFRASVRPGTPDHRSHLAAILRRCQQAGATALVVHSDPDAISLVQFCAEQGIAIPQDLAIVSYDDEIAQLGEPPLTAIRPAKGHLGRMAVELLVSRLIEGSRRPAHRLLVVPELVVRSSSVRPTRH